MIRRVMGTFVALMLVTTLLLPLASVGAQEEIDPGPAPVTTEETAPESAPPPAVEEPPIAAPQPEAPPVDAAPVVDEPVVEQPAIEQPAQDTPPVEAPEAQEPAAAEPSTEEPAAADPVADEPAPSVEPETVETANSDEPEVVESADEESNPTVIENLSIDCTGLLTYDVVEAHGEELGVLIRTTDPNVATGPMGNFYGYVLFINSEGHSSSTVDMSANPGNVFVTINSSAVGGPIAESPIADCHEFTDPEPDPDPEQEPEPGPSSVISGVSVTCDGTVTFTISEAYGETLRVAVTDPRAPSPHYDLASGSFEATEAGTFSLEFEIDARDTVRATISSLSSNNYASAFVPNCLTEDEEIEPDIVSNLTVTCDGDVSLAVDDAIVGMIAGLHLYGSNGSSWQSIGFAPLPFSGSITHEFEVPAGVWDSLRIEATAKWSLLGAATVSNCLDDETPDPGDGDIVTNLAVTCDGVVSFTVPDLLEAGRIRIFDPQQNPELDPDQAIDSKVFPRFLYEGTHSYSLNVPAGEHDQLVVVLSVYFHGEDILGQASVSGCLGGGNPDSTDGVQISNLRLFCNGLVRFDVTSGDPADLLLVLTTSNMEDWQRTSSGTFATGSQEVRFGVPAGWFDDLSVAIVQDGDTLTSTSVSGCLTSDPNEITGDQVLVFTTYGSVLFDRVTEGGETIIERYMESFPGEFPAEFDQSSARLFDLSTTATFEGSIQVCLNLSQEMTDNPDRVRVLQYWHGSWIEADTEVHIDQGIACANATRLSIFATALLAGDPEPEPVLPVVSNLVTTCTGLVSFDLETAEPVELQVWVGTPAQAPGFHAETYITATSGPQQVQLDIPVGRFDRHTAFVALDADEWHQLAETVTTGCRDQTTPPNTPAGSDVVVEVGGGSVGFDAVLVPGVTTVTVLDPGQAPVLPSGFDPNTAILLDISTTAVFDGAVQVCVPVSADFGDMSAAQLLHFENGAWVDITTSIDAGNRTICGQTSSFSPYAVVKPFSAGPDPEQPGSNPQSPGHHGPAASGNVQSNASATGGAAPLSGLPNTGSGASTPGEGAQTIHLLLCALALLAAGILRLTTPRKRGTHSR